MTSRKFTRDPEAAAAKRSALVASLEDGFTRCQDSGEYKAYLDVAAKFHNYSINNQMLIWMQRPHAQRVAGFHTWLSLGRAVRKGEKGISIMAPMTYSKTVERDGEEVDETRIAFRSVAVFDIAQTDGDDLPEAPVTRLAGDDELGLYDELATIAAAENLPITREEQPGQEANGYYNRARGLIWVSPELVPTMAAKTLCHELAHHFGGSDCTRQENETIAESVAYLVLGHFGIDASDYSFGYLACWTDAKTFKAKLADIHATANQIIERIEGREDICAA